MYKRQELIVSYLGMLEKGAVPVLLDAKMGKQQLGRLFAIYQPGYVLSLIHIFSDGAVTIRPPAISSARRAIS